MASGIRCFTGIALLMYVICYVRGEMRFVCPRPQLPNSAITEGPCGAGKDEPFNANYMEVSPGPLTIHLEETIAHKGAPIRIALMEWNTNAGSCVLLDHIPHNDASTPIPSPSCTAGVYPLGQCYSAQTYITVQIPDIECDKCVLQMINVATDMYTDVQKPCHQRDDAYNNCTAFYSCANIRIHPTPNGVGKGIGSCAFYKLSLKEKWPYTPVLFFKINLGPPFTSDNYLYLYERPDWTLEFELNLSNTNVSVRSGSAGIFQRAMPIAFFHGFSGKVRGINAARRELLHNGTYHIRITARFRNGTYKNYRFPIWPAVSRFQESYYRNHGIKYSSGFLSGRNFAGPEATYKEVNYPAGQCQSPGKESFGGILTFHKSVLPRALVTFTISRDLLFAQVASSFEMNRLVFNTKWNTTGGDPAQRNMLVNRGGVSGYMFQGAEFIDDELARTGGRTPNGASVVVIKDKTLDVLLGDVRRGIKAEIKDGDNMVGLAFVELNQQLPSFNIYVMVSNSTGFLPNDFEISLEGPSETLPISKVKTPVQLDGDAYFCNVAVPIIDMEIPQFLWTGQFSVSIKSMDTSMTYKGQLERLSTAVCEGYNNVACRARILLTPGGKFVDRGASSVPPNGMAMIAIGSEQMVMDISISVQDLKEGDTIESVQILRDGGSYLVIPNMNFKPVLPIKSRRFAKIQMGLNAEIMRHLSDNLLSVTVTVNRTGSDGFVISGRIYPASVSSPGFVISEPQGQPQGNNKPPPPLNPWLKPTQTERETEKTRTTRFNPFGQRESATGNTSKFGLNYMLISCSLLLVLMCLR